MRQLLKTSSPEKYDPSQANCNIEHRILIGHCQLGKFSEQSATDFR